LSGIADERTIGWHMNGVGEDHVHGRGWAALEFGEREVVLRADLDERDDEDCVWTSMRFLMQGPRPPRPGEMVVLVDTGGGSCVGRVMSVAGWEARVRPDWRTWIGPAHPQVHR
jgi:hypothetical protein